MFRALCPRLVGVGILVAGPVFSDDFDSYANGTDLGSQFGWANGGGSIIITKPGALGEAAAATTYSLAYSRAAYLENQYAEITLGTTVVDAGGGQMGVAVSVSGSNYYYVVYTCSAVGNEIFYLVKIIAGGGGIIAQTTLGSVKCVASDVIRLERTGSGAATRLTVKKNAVAIAALTSIDPTEYITGGVAGIYSYGNPCLIRAASWRSGNL